MYIVFTLFKLLPSAKLELSVAKLAVRCIKLPLAVALVLMRGTATRVLFVATLLTQLMVSGLTLPFKPPTVSSTTGSKVVADSEAHTESLLMMEILLDTDHFELLEEIAESGDPSLVNEGVFLTSFS